MQNKSSSLFQTQLKMYLFVFIRHTAGRYDVYVHVQMLCTDFLIYVMIVLYKGVCV